MTGWLPGNELISGTEKRQGFVYVQADCGCVLDSMYDDPEIIAYFGKAILRHVKAGREIRKAADRTQLPPWYCNAHRPEGWTDR